MTERGYDEGVGALPRRLRFLTAGFLRQARLRRILALAGHGLRPGLPRAGEGVVVWGHSPHAWRGERAAARAGAPLCRVEDTLLRSVRPGRAGDAPLGLMIEGDAAHYDPSRPSRVETILARDPLDDAALLARARDGIARLHALDLSKYNLHDPALAPPVPGYVLVIDQTVGDASLRLSGAGPSRMAEMLATAMAENPGTRVIVKTHPETALGLRRGHFDPATLPAGVSLLADPVSPWALLEGAVAVHTVSSQMGLEAILAGHRPHLWGQPFYAGWGLSEDRMGAPARRGRKLTRAQLFAAAMILAPTWYDPCRDRLCRFEEAVDQLEAEVRAFREDRAGWVAGGMRLWKRPHLRTFFGGGGGLRFAATAGAAQAQAARGGRRAMAWAGTVPEGTEGIVRIEDGFLRSRGLGADLVAPLSLVADDLGIYYDPRRESRLERLILSPAPPGAETRARALQAAVLAGGISKYNLAPGAPLHCDLPPGRRILVPGQVEDDASIRLGAGEVRTNLDLLRRVRTANPDAVILYKPHPDVEAGLRPGALLPAQLAGLADLVATGADPVALIDVCDEVWTITSLLGFEALLRGRSVTCLGAPFYSGWGLTRDLGPLPLRRRQAADGHPLPRPALWRLVHAALVEYPRYRDPSTGLPCPPEVAVHRLATGTIPPRGPALRLLAKAQGVLASWPWIWR